MLSLTQNLVCINIWGCTLTVNSKADKNLINNANNGYGYLKTIYAKNDCIFQFYLNTLSLDKQGRYFIVTNPVNKVYPDFVKLATTSDIKVNSVNGQTGNVTVDAGVTSVNGQKGAVSNIATSSDVTNATSSVRSDFEGSISMVNSLVKSLASRISKLEQKKPIYASWQSEAETKPKQTNDLYYF